jgi:hypothetical protein
MNWKQPIWQRDFRDLSGSQRQELAFIRGAVAVMIPVSAYFYSPRLGAILAFPCAYALYVYLSRAVKAFTRRD